MAWSSLTFLSPPLASRVFPYVVSLGLLGAGAMILWRLIVGVDEQKWKDRARLRAEEML
ncbi:MAG TPA: hypothetical protein VH763_08530 [Gemmatimonadales bacterium]